MTAPPQPTIPRCSGYKWLNNLYGTLQLLHTAVQSAAHSLTYIGTAGCCRPGPRDASLLISLLSMWAETEEQRLQASLNNRRVKKYRMNRESSLFSKHVLRL